MIATPAILPITIPAIAPPDSPPLSEENRNYNVTYTPLNEHIIHIENNRMIFKFRHPMPFINSFI